MMTTMAVVHDILPPGVFEKMARRRHQACPVQRTKTIGGKNDQWFIRYRLDFITDTGKTEYKEAPVKYLGYCKKIGIRAAEALRDEFLTTINKPSIVIPSQVKFGLVLTQYLANSTVRDTSLERYKCTAAKHIAPRWAESRMCDIRQMELEQWLNEISRKMGKQCYAKVKTVFSETWNCAIRWGYTQNANPISLLPKKFGRPKPPVKLILPEPDGLALIIKCMREDWRLASELEMYTAMRISEVLGTRYSDFEKDVMTVTWTVTQKGERLPVTKTDAAARDIPVAHVRALVMLRRPVGAKSSDFIFKPDYFSYNRALKRAMKLAGLEQKGAGSHQFRRGHNTIFRSIADVELAMAQLGHTTVAMNDAYNYPGKKEMKARAEASVKVMDTVNRMMVN